MLIHVLGDTGIQKGISLNDNKRRALRSQVKISTVAQVFILIGLNRFFSFLIFEFKVQHRTP